MLVIGPSRILTTLKNSSELLRTPQGFLDLTLMMQWLDADVESKKITT